MGLFLLIKMKLFTFVLNPLEFHIESDCATPEEALRDALKCGTPDEIFLLNYLQANLEDHPTLDGSVECLYFDEC